MDTKERLRQSQESKAKAIDKTKKVITKLKTICDSVVKLSKEKSNLEKKLIIKEQVWKLLCEMLMKEYNQGLQHKIERKQKKMKRLEEVLQMKNHELKSSLEEIQSKQEELLQAQQEMWKQHKKVMQLLKEKEELACSYNILKERVSKHVQIMLAFPDEKKVTSIYIGYVNIPLHCISTIQLVVSQFENIQCPHSTVLLGE